MATGGVTESDVRDYAASLLRGSGESEAAARRAAVRVAKIESALATAALPGEVDLWGDASTEHVLDRAELARTTPRIPWSRYFAMVEAPERINVNAPAYLEAVQRVLAATSERGLRDYFRVQFLHQLGPHLPDDAQPPDSPTRRDACRRRPSTPSAWSSRGSSPRARWAPTAATRRRRWPTPCARWSWRRPVFARGSLRSPAGPRRTSHGLGDARATQRCVGDGALAAIEGAPPRRGRARPRDGEAAEVARA
jgi:hypothetical protein